MVEIVIRIISLFIWTLFILWVIHRLRCSRREGFAADSFTSLVDIDKQLKVIETFLKDPNQVFNQLEKRDEKQVSGYDKMKQWIVNKHKAMIDIEKQKLQAKMEEEAKKRDPNYKPPKEAEKKMDEIPADKDTERYFEVERFTATPIEINRYGNILVSRYRVCERIIGELERDMTPMNDWKEYVYRMRKKGEGFLDYARLQADEMAVSGKPQTLTPEERGEKPYEENVYSRIVYTLKLKTNHFDTQESSFFVLQIPHIDKAVKSLDQRARLYNLQLIDIYKLYNEEMNDEVRKVGKAVDIAKDEYQRNVDDIMAKQATTEPSTDLVAGMSRGSGAVGAITGSTSNMNISPEEKKASDAATKGAMDNLKKELA